MRHSCSASRRFVSAIGVIVAMSGARVLAQSATSSAASPPVYDYFTNGADATSVTSMGPWSAYFTNGMEATSVPAAGQPGAEFFTRGADVTSVPLRVDPNAVVVPTTNSPIEDAPASAQPPATKTNPETKPSAVTEPAATSAEVPSLRARGVNRNDTWPPSEEPLAARGRTATETSVEPMHAQPARVQTTEQPATGPDTQLEQDTKRSSDARLTPSTATGTHANSDQLSKAFEAYAVAVIGLAALFTFAAATFLFALTSTLRGARRRKITAH